MGRVWGWQEGAGVAVRVLVEWKCGLAQVGKGRMDRIDGSWKLSKDPHSFAVQPTVGLPQLPPRLSLWSHLLPKIQRPVPGSCCLDHGPQAGGWHSYV